MKNNQGLTITPQEYHKDKYQVTVPKHLRDNDWSATIGTIQRTIDNLGRSKHGINFDFTDCRWIDPLPLLSMLIEIVYTKKRGIEIDVSFPMPDDGPKNEENQSVYQQSPNRLLIFLAKEGFFDELERSQVVAKIGNSIVDAATVKKLETLTASPSYADAHFIPMRLYDVPNLPNDPVIINRRDTEFAAQTVDDLLSQTEVTLHARCSAPERRHLLYNLRAVLQEFLHNVQEHAYPENGTRLAALYVRYRQGGATFASAQEKKFYGECVKQESMHCSKTSRDWLDSRHGCLEVFFLDRGVGLACKMNAENSENSFVSVMRSTFFLGESTKKIRLTEHGGLHLLHNLMRRGNDYVRAINDNTWFGSSVPFDRLNEQVTNHIKGIGTGTSLAPDQGIIGLGYHLRLGWNASTQNSDAWRSFNKNEADDVWRELCRPAESCKDLFDWFEKNTVWDERFVVSPPESTQADFVLLLPKPNRMKWDILDRLEILAGCIKEGSTLVIADIPSREAATYRAAMSNSSFGSREEWPKKFKRVVLITNRWSFAYAEHVTTSTGLHGFTTFSNEEIPTRFKSGISKALVEISFRQLLIHWVKWHDSKCIWGEIDKSKRLFLAEEIIWKEDDEHRPLEIIKGYLDFSATTHNPLCAALYRNALGRVFGLLDESSTELVPVDSLADPVVHDVYANEVYDPPDHGSHNIEKVAVGSVLVSGATLKAAGLKRDVHFFVHARLARPTIRFGDRQDGHSSSPDPNRAQKPGQSLGESEFGECCQIEPVLLQPIAGRFKNWAFCVTVGRRADEPGDSGSEHPALFHWIPMTTIRRVETTQKKRIGKTSAIAPDGWLSIEIPRYDTQGEAVGGCSPEDTYKDLQSPGPVIVKVGHWCYEGHHDLITINIPDAVEDSFARNGPLANYLVTTVLPFIGVCQDDLVKKNWKGYPIKTPTPGILIYRSHPSSERIMNMLLATIHNKNLPDTKNKIFPILPLRRRFGSSTLLIPPGIKKEIYESSGRKSVMIFDDAAITGRTIQDLITSLRELGAEKIRVVLIANRLRLPSETRAVEYYWRIDIPTMGREGSCPLCHSLDLARSFSAHIVTNSPSLNNLQCWVREWSTASPITKWDAGLNPIPLAPHYKDFCYRRNNKPKYLTKIPIFRSTGLTIHAAEIHAMTARDDYGLKKIRELNEPAIQVELAASQLLLFGNELDQDLIHEFMAEGLLVPMGRLPDKSPSAALAVFVVMHALALLTPQAQRIVAAEARKKIASLLPVSHGLVLMAYFLDRDLLDRSDDACYPALRLLSTRHSSVAEKLRSLFRETLTPIGAAHSEPIPKLYERLCKNNTPSDKEVSDALDSLASIRDIIHELGSELARCVDRSTHAKTTYADRMRSLVSSIDEAVQLLKEDFTTIAADNIRKHIKQVIDSLNCVADCYFHRMSPGESTRGRSFVDAVASIWAKSISWDDVWDNHSCLTQFTQVIRNSDVSGMNGNFGNADWIWIPWHKHIVNLVRDILMNVIHRSESIADPWDATSTLKADMWVLVLFEPRTVSICFANGCTKELDTIFQEVEKGTNEKTRWSPLVELGGAVEIDRNLSRDQSLLVLKITIPYAPYLALQAQQEI